jgi:serine phosphatase RsbU (regulator of sigma subunit)
MGEKPARYFAFGTLLMIAGGLLLFLGASKIIILHNNIIFYQAGVIGQIFVFSLGLTERYRKTEDDKHEAERRLIIQLQENDKLHTRVTTELEEKVKERTKEIERKNDEILAQSKEIEQQKNDILKKSEQVAHINQEIKHSINYASRIQTALFNDINEIEKSFREAFVFLRAKDIVSGDFYWYTEIPKNSKTTKKLNIQNQATILPQDSIFPYSYKKEKKITSRVIENQEFKKKIFIVADCTGHGVPGAFMTVMCYSILHETINEKGILEPDEILYELDKKVIESLRKGNSDNQVQDGMEITIMVYDEEDHTITYAAAGNPLYLIRNFDIQIYPASSHSIGFSKKIKQKIFEKQTISILEDDIFYMTTDGFQDQFGGSEKRKYMKKNMREFFLKISHLPLKEQKEKIRQELENWQGNQPQTDDILIAAVKF